MKIVIFDNNFSEIYDWRFLKPLNTVTARNIWKYLRTERGQKVSKFWKFTKMRFGAGQIPV